MRLYSHPIDLTSYFWSDSERCVCVYSGAQCKQCGVEHTVRGYAVFLRQWLSEHQGEQFPRAPAEASGLCCGLQWLKDLLPACLLHGGGGGASGV